MTIGDIKNKFKTIWEAEIDKMVASMELDDTMSSEMKSYYKGQLGLALEKSIDAVIEDLYNEILSGDAYSALYGKITSDMLNDSDFLTNLRTALNNTGGS